MIEFMVLGMPRSGTAWCANWLTTDLTLCLHDPLWKKHYSELDNIHSRYGRSLGVACTGLALFPDFVNAHPSRKVILHREAWQVNAALENLRMPRLGPQWDGALDRIKGMHVDWQDIFRAPQPIYEHLLCLPFDQERHQLLENLNVQMDYERQRPDPAVTLRLFGELKAAGGG